MNVVLFTGGSGNANLIRYIKDLSYVNLSLLINGYDDGLSTGTIRSANYGMLGPSDFRKNFTYILDSFSDSNLNIKKIFNHRLSQDECHLLLNNKEELFEHLTEEKKIEEKSKNFIKIHFYKGVEKLLSYTKEADLLIDFNVGNIIIGGLYRENQDFNAALRSLTDFFDLNARLINVSVDDDSKLVAFDKNSVFLSNEADIVNYKGDEPLDKFFLLPLDKYNKLDTDTAYQPEEINAVSKTPVISNQAKKAIKNADILLFGSGTLFSSLLPSYRICKKEINSSNAKKVLIINNDYDNDIRNITLDHYISLILNELDAENQNYFDRIILDSDSRIIHTDEALQSNVVKAKITNTDLKHNGYRLWNTITRTLEQHKGKCKIKLILSEETDHTIKDIYASEIKEYNENTLSNIEFVLNGTPEETFNYYLILDTSGKVSLYDVETWVNFATIFNFDCIFGYRFYSRRQMIISFKKKLVESRLTYFSSIIISHIVSIIYFLRFFRFKADPLSGIYLIKAKEDFQYDGVPQFLKYVNKNNIEVHSLPITYRTFKNVDYMKKSVTLIKNIFKLFILIFYDERK